MPTVKAKLVSIKDQDYTKYIFELLEHTDMWDHFVAATRLPNWDLPNIFIGDVGYLEFRDVEAGVDKWYDSERDEFVAYRYTMIRLEDFTHEKTDTDVSIRL